MRTDTNTIYSYALRDVNTESYPLRDNGSFIFPFGMRRILSKYEKLKSLYSENDTLKNKRKDLISGMLSKQRPFDTNQTSVSIKEQELVNEVNTSSVTIEILKEEIKDEEQRLLNRDIPLPEKPKEDEEDVVGNNDVNKNKLLQMAKEHWKTAKKWLGVLFVIVLLEGFFGLSMWDTLRDSKSIIQVMLRIAASGALVVTLHLAERKYKENNAKIFAGYIVFGIINLIVLLIGSLVIGYFYPEVISNGTISSDVFDLSGSETIQSFNAEKSMAGLYIRYDFMIGALSVIVYMLISFLDKSKKTDKIADEDMLDKNNQPFHPHIATIHLKHLYATLAAEERKLVNLKAELKSLKDEPSKLLKGVLVILKNNKNKIESIDTRITEVENTINSLYIEIESELENYKADFMDVFKSKPAYQFVQLEWPKREDIKKYYNII